MTVSRMFACLARYNLHGTGLVSAKEASKKHTIGAWMIYLRTSIQCTIAYDRHVRICLRPLVSAPLTVVAEIYPS